MTNSDTEPLATFTAHIENVPDQDHKRLYQYTDYRHVVDKRTDEVTDGHYRFSIPCQPVPACQIYIS